MQNQIEICQCLSHCKSLKHNMSNQRLLLEYWRRFNQQQQKSFLECGDAVAAASAAAVVTACTLVISIKLMIFSSANWRLTATWWDNLGNWQNVNLFIDNSIIICINLKLIEGCMRFFVMLFKIFIEIDYLSCSNEEKFFKSF